MTFDPSAAMVVAALLQLVTLAGGLWSLARRLARLEMMVDLMWEAFSKRFEIREMTRRK